MAFQWNSTLTRDKLLKYWEHVTLTRMHRAFFFVHVHARERFSAYCQAPRTLIVSHSIHPHRDASRSVGRHSCLYVFVFF